MRSWLAVAAADFVEVEVAAAFVAEEEAEDFARRRVAEIGLLRGVGIDHSRR
ncbi:MAG: hypothetical protein U1D30_23425 [Planctomycetota bacterium]